MLFFKVIFNWSGKTIELHAGFTLSPEKRMLNERNDCTENMAKKYRTQSFSLFIERKQPLSFLYIVKKNTSLIYWTIQLTK